MPDEHGLYTYEEMVEFIKQYEHRMMKESGMFLKCPYCEEYFYDPVTNKRKP